MMKIMSLVAKAVGWIVLAAIADIVYQYFMKPEFSFERTVGFALVFGLCTFFYECWKNKKNEKNSIL